MEKFFKIIEGEKIISDNVIEISKKLSEYNDISKAWLMVSAYCIQNGMQPGAKDKSALQDTIDYISNLIELSKLAKLIQN